MYSGQMSNQGKFASFSSLYISQNFVAKLSKFSKIIKLSY